MTIRQLFAGLMLCVFVTFAYAGDAEDVFWESVVRGNVQEEYELYLKQYPKGRHVKEAQQIIEGMRKKARAQQEAKKQKQAQAKAEAAKKAAEEAMRPGRVFRDCPDCPEMVVIPAGSFMMGSPASEQERSSDEGPQHEVTIARQFAAGKYEVTFDEWDACVRESGCSHNPDDRGWGRTRRPVMNVSWDDAKQYVQWLSRKTGRNYRLLTEAEWEYVARAGTTTAFSFGSTITPQQANYDTKVTYAGSPVVAFSRGQTEPVGSFEPNAFGLYDVHGNVWEWTEDCWNGSYSDAPTNGSAWISGDCGGRVLRGGSWTSDPEYLRSAYRGRFIIGVLAIIGSQRSAYGGFRVARTQ